MKKLALLLISIAVTGCAQGQQGQQPNQGDNAALITDMFNAFNQSRIEGNKRAMEIRQQNYDQAVRQQQIYNQQQLNNSYIQQGKCYTDAFAQQRCY